MASQEKLPTFWKHALITGVLCLMLFPILPLMYLAGLAFYYGGGLAWKNKGAATKAATGWIPWKFIGIGFLTLLTGVVIFTTRHDPRSGEPMSDKEAQAILVYAAISLPLWLAAFYLPTFLRWKAARRVSEENELILRQSEERRRLNDRKTMALQMSNDLEKMLGSLEAKRREFFRSYLIHKPFIDERDWPESLFTDFERYKRDIEAGRGEEVTLKLQALHASLERAGMIGRLRADYKKRQPVIGKDISERAFESLLRGIPEMGDFHSACQDVQAILVQAYGDRASAWTESESERHLDNLLDSMDSQEEPQGDVSDNMDIVPLKKRIS